MIFDKNEAKGSVCYYSTPTGWSEESEIPLESHDLRHSIGGEQTKDHIQRIKYRSKCSIGTCMTRSEHMKKHVLVQHLPGFVDPRCGLNHNQRMESFQRLLEQISENVGGNSLGELLSKVRTIQW